MYYINTTIGKFIDTGKSRNKEFYTLKAVCREMKGGMPGLGAEATSGTGVSLLANAGLGGEETTANRSKFIGERRVRR